MVTPAMIDTKRVQQRQHDASLVAQKFPVLSAIQSNRAIIDPACSELLIRGLLGPRRYKGTCQQARYTSIFYLIFHLSVPLSKTMNLDETSPLLRDPRYFLEQVINHHHASPEIPIVPEEAGATHRFGPRLLASLLVDAIPGTHVLRNMSLPPSQTIAFHQSSCHTPYKTRYRRPPSW